MVALLTAAVEKHRPQHGCSGTLRWEDPRLKLAVVSVEDALRCAMVALRRASATTIVSSQHVELLVVSWYWPALSRR